MYCKRLVSFSILVLPFFFTSLCADDYSHVLTARPVFSSGDHEAVVTWSNGDFCYLPINEASSVAITDSEVHIVSPGVETVNCITPRPPEIFYEQTALIGELAPGEYTVYWDQTDNISLSTTLVVSAQQGPEVPCVGCENLVHAPLPETGSWYNPDQSGSGLNFEIQNGVLAGYYYGYDASGLPEWQLITGPLVRSEQQGMQWALRTQLQQFEDGNCIGCEYVPPMGPTSGPAIKLEFQQRNYMRLTIGDNPSQFFVPIIYGSGGYAYFSEQTPYTFPAYGNDTFFVLILKPNTDPPMPENWESLIVPVGPGKMGSGNSQGQLVYKTWFPQSTPPGPDVFWDFIVCDLESTSGQPVCKIFAGSKEYLMPIANMSDSRFFGEAEDGSTIEAYRLGYD